MNDELILMLIAIALGFGIVYLIIIIRDILYWEEQEGEGE